MRVNIDKDIWVEPCMSTEWYAVMKKDLRSPTGYRIIQHFCSTVTKLLNTFAYGGISL